MINVTSYIMDREIISPDIDGSCDVYSSLNFAYPLAENGLLICVFIKTHGICFPRLVEYVSPIYCVTFIVEVHFNFYCNSTI